MSEGMAQLREQSAEHRLDGTAVSAAIFAHLQTARSERLSAVPSIASASQTADAANLRRAVQELDAQQTQTDVLKSLLRGAVQHADRVALFVVKNDQAIGWRMAKANDPDLEMIGGVSLPVTAQTIVTRAVRTRMTASGADAADSEYAMLLDQLGGAPAAVAAIPLVVRGKVVAVLYADSPSTDGGAMNLDAVELLTRVASMAVNLVSIQRASAPAAAAAEPAPAPAAVEYGYTPQVEEPAAAEEAGTDSHFATPVKESVEAAPTEAAEVEAGQPTFEDAEAHAEEPYSSFTTEPAPPAISEQPWEAGPTVMAEPTAPTEPLPAPEELSQTPASFEPGTTPPPFEAQPMASDSGYSSSFSAPLGTSRRYGVSEPELPVDVSEDERRLHNDARRFARLLVSEIKLYNEPKVQEGRSKGDLYDRLRDDIDRSRQMYDKRVAPPVAARHDYFHQELVNTLAEGDVAKLGMSYPGASVSAV